MTLSNRNKVRNLPPNSLYILLLTCISMLLLLSGCSSAPESRYAITQDTAPSFDYGEIVYDAIIPTLEPHNTWTSRPYYVFGEKYYPMASAIGFEETGGASWYGLKFHGHKTANGEIFDMFALTAAHKTLPLPSFVRVTNVKNGKSAIVRVNDRGPFHSTRIIDLSYGAAKKLGYHKYGVADVKMEVLDVNEAGEIRIGSSPQLYVFENGELLAKRSAQEKLSEKTLLAQNSAPQPIPQSLFVQVMAMENGDKIREFASSLSSLLQVPNVVPKIANIYRLQLGPLETEQKAQNIIQELKKIGFEQAFTIQVMP